MVVSYPGDGMEGVHEEDGYRCYDRCRVYFDR